MMDLLDQGYEYCNKNWFVLPVKAKDKEPITSIAHQGYKSATNNFWLIPDWLQEQPDMNLGIACEMSQLIVLDIDYRNLTDKSWVMAEHLFREYKNTMIVETGDGVHMYFTTESLSGVKGKLASGIDIKYKGYVVAPPSVHSNGKRYEANGLEPVALPDYIREWVTK
jgi:hypothetical protein